MAEQRTQTESEQGKILIVGLGETGLSCARFLQARGLPVAVADSRTQPPGLAALREQLPDAALFLGEFDPQVFAAAQRLIVSPGISLKEPLIHAAVERGAEVLGDIELFAREAKAPVIAITGSNGKSTVTALVGEMARCAQKRVAVGGNLGPPALDLLRDEVELYVLELSSFQLETTRSLHPQAAVVLNLSEDHLDRYTDLNEYAAAKAGIYQGAAVRVYNRNDDAVMAMRKGCGAELFFTQQEPAAGEFGLRRIAGETWLCRGEQALLAASELLIPGRHNLANALAALALGSAVELPMPAMLKALRRFRGLPHRSQFVAEKRGVRWYNDSKATNVGACLAALEGLAAENSTGRIVLIAGGIGKGANFSPLAGAIARTCRAVVLIGRDAPLIEAVLDKHIAVEHASGMDEAVQRVAQLARPGDQVLLSPACASFDLFRNFEHRGECFERAVRGLPA